MLRAGQSIADLQASFHKQGRIEWIGLRETVRGPVTSVNRARLMAGRGLQGDHRSARAGGARQVTLMQYEHLAVIAEFCGLAGVEPALLRRNIVVSGINILCLRDWQFRIGTALLEGSGRCHPCSRMQETLGEGGYSAVRGHGGITARILVGGNIAVGARLQPVARIP